MWVRGVWVQDEILSFLSEQRVFRHGERIDVVSLDVDTAVGGLLIQISPNSFPASQFTAPWFSHYSFPTTNDMHVGFPRADSSLALEDPWFRLRLPGFTYAEDRHSEDDEESNRPCETVIHIPVLLDIVRRHPNPAAPVVTQSIVLAWWPVMLLAGILPSFRFFSWRRRRLRRRSGMCVKCSYDLRASKDRCPECGTPVPVSVRDSAQTAL